MKEEWKGLFYREQDFSKLFEVSNLGNIRRVGSEINLKQWTRRNGYKTIAVSLGSKKNVMTLKMHKAILESFCGINEYKIEVNHIDFDRGNNELENLEWVTPKENTQHSIENIKKSCKRGIEDSSSKLKKEDILYIRENYIPFDKEFGCRALARKFNMSHPNILRVINNLSYCNI